MKIKVEYSCIAPASDCECAAQPCAVPMNLFLRLSLGTSVKKPPAVLYLVCDQNRHLYGL
jgi:hypothetical protein